MKALRWIGRPFAWLAMGLIRVYQLVFSPMKYFFFGANAGCRFSPSCSQYALECFKTLPLFRAIYLSIYRILRCNPWGGQGYDPVPGSKGCCGSESESEKGQDSRES